jgi:polar amino acid transport system substrate-binding protein
LAVVMKPIVALFFILCLPVSVQAQQIRIGVPANTAGWSFHDRASNSDKGIVFDLLKAMQLGPAEIFPVAFGSLVTALHDKKIDLVVGNLTITPERQQLVDFSTPFFTGADGLIVAKSDTTDYKTWDDMKGLSVGTFTGSIYLKPLTESGLFSEVKTFASPDEAVREVNEGHIKAAIGPGVSLAYIVSQGHFPNVRLVKTYQPKFTSPIALAVRKGDTVLLARVNAALSRLQDDGELKAIFTKWGQ